MHCGPSLELLGFCQCLLITSTEFSGSDLPVSLWFQPPARGFEFLVQRIESLGLEENILGDVNCYVAVCPLESLAKNLLEICNLY